MKIEEKLTETHEKFLRTIDGYVLGEFLVGSFVYAEEKNLSDKSDLDIICIVKNDKLDEFLNTRYLKGLIEPEIAHDVLDGRVSDYLVLKFHIDNILLSVDVISPEFFKTICNTNLIQQKESFMSHKYGNEPQLNKYDTYEFDGITHYIQKHSSEYKGGYSVELPLFFISEKGKYMPGIPSIKYITHKIFIDAGNMIKDNIDNLYRNIVQKLLKEHPNLNNDECVNYFFNILKGREKFPEEYRNSLKNKVVSLIKMEEIIESIRNEVYSLFRDDIGEKKYLYVRKDWIFPNHIDVMIELAEDMCAKYGGDISTCKIAILLHDTGLVYGREEASPKGHEERSIEYASEILNKYDLSENIINEVVKCIKATDASELPESVNEKIVRTADALSQFISVHFYAKAAFSGDWDFYSGWLKKKAANNFKKICFEDEQKRAEPIRKYILEASEMYEKNGKNYFNKKMDDEINSLDKT